MYHVKRSRAVYPGVKVREAMEESVSKRKKKRDTKEKQDKTGKMRTAKQWWESEFKGSVHATDLFVAEKFTVDERTVGNWRTKWRKDGWKQPTIPQVQ